MAHPVVSHDEWLAARTAFLAKEKEFTHQRDALNKQRRELPWEKIEKNYVFDGPAGAESLRTSSRTAVTPEQVASGDPVFNFRTMQPGREDREGASVFFKNENGEIFHTYSTFGRGIDMFNTAYHYLDIAPKGRDEDNLPFTQSWVRHHDRYES